MKAKGNDKTDAALVLLEEGIGELVTSEKWAEHLRVQARFRQYSFGNVMLIARQRPDATRVAGFHAWKAFDRSVKKGAKGIFILAPMARRIGVEEDGEVVERHIVTGFRLAYVFDVSDTEGKDLPQVVTLLSGDAPTEAFSRLSYYAASLGFPVDREDPPVGANGVCYTAEGSRRISVRDSLSPAQSVKTLAHEIAHAVLHADIPPERNRGVNELEAESTAFVVCHGLGIDSGDYTFGYVTEWSGTDTVKTIQKSGSRIQKTARQMLDAAETAVEMEVAA